MKAMVKVVMLRDAKGAPDSTTVRTYKAGETYDIPEDLAGCFFSTGDADPAEAHQEPDAEVTTNSPAETQPPAPRKRGAKATAA